MQPDHTWFEADAVFDAIDGLLCRFNPALRGLKPTSCGLNSALCRLDPAFRELNPSLCRLSLAVCELSPSLCTLDVAVCGLHPFLCKLELIACELNPSLYRLDLAVCGLDPALCGFDPVLCRSEAVRCPALSKSRPWARSEAVPGVSPRTGVVAIVVMEPHAVVESRKVLDDTVQNVFRLQVTSARRLYSLGNRER